MAFLMRFLFFISLFSLSCSLFAQGLTFQDVSRFKGVRANDVVGYGIVTGLAGTGDSPRTVATVESLKNALQRFGVVVSADDVRSRNVAAVMLTAKLGEYSQEGDQIDVTVSSIGDARSLVGGTLLLTELQGPDGRLYALAQGPLLVGGYYHEVAGNSVQKNHPTTATIPGGAVDEVEMVSDVFSDDATVTFILDAPDIKTSVSMANLINLKFSDVSATAQNAANVAVDFSDVNNGQRLQRVMEISDLPVDPFTSPTVVVNERTGTVVYGGEVTISKISITHGSLKVVIDSKVSAYTPDIAIGNQNTGLQVTNSEIDALDEPAISGELSGTSSVSELVSILNRMNATSGDVISILQAIKRAGALHADLVVQ